MTDGDALTSGRTQDVIATPSQWTRLLLGLCVVLAVFQWSAVALGSDRGQAGLAVGAPVVATTLVVERVVFGQRLLPALRALGFGRPRTTGLVVTCGICLLLLVVLLVFVRVTGASAVFSSDALSLTPGLFAQAGIAEEVLFRGYLYGHLRHGRSFWRAAWLSMLPFVGVHLLLFFTMPWPIALAALLLSVVLSFPFAHLFELGGGTFWAPALLHAVIQGTVKVVVVAGDAASVFPFVWMTASATLPMLAFGVSRSQRLWPPR
ncbi:MAG: CPBP family intramembrane metalloprotease [Acidobacteria bacterium]|nr:CPBP family intramembrane metalloprotease [Acidobacteriota bacterium]